MIKSSITSMMDQTNISKSSPSQKDSPKTLDPTIVVLDKRRATSLDSRNSKQIVGMWYLKHEITPPKLYKLLIKTERKH